MRMHIWLLTILVALLMFTGCADQRDAAPTPVAPTPPTVAETKASADVAKETIVTQQLTNVGNIKTTADADKQIALLNARIVAINAEQDALKTELQETRGALTTVTKEKVTIQENADARLTHLIAGLCLLAAVILGVFWWFAPPNLKDADGKAALVAGTVGAVLYVVAAYIFWVVWVGLAILVGLGIYILNRTHLVANVFTQLIKDGHVVLQYIGRAGWVQAMVDDVVAVLVKLHLRHTATAPLVSSTTTALAAKLPIASAVAAVPVTPAAPVSAQSVPPAPTP